MGVCICCFFLLSVLIHTLVIVAEVPHPTKSWALIVTAHVHSAARQQLSTGGSYYAKNSAAAVSYRDPHVPDVSRLLRIGETHARYCILPRYHAHLWRHLIGRQAECALLSFLGSKYLLAVHGDLAMVYENP